MARVVEFYFDYGSPYSYIAHRRLPEVLRRAGGEARYRIMLLGGVFQLTGNQSPATNPLKWPNSQRDLERYVAKYQVPFRRNPHFPVNTLKAMRGAVVAEAEGFLPRYTDALFTAMWCQGEKLDDDAVLARVLDAAGIDAALVLSRIADDAVKQTLKSHTEAAARRGVFGAPTFFVDDEMFFGQDRLDFVEDALNGRSYLRDSAR
ncbi:MAG TPA: 2-hydroxychromene-2-carboxylate isomerase [Stellaceae bacterium]|nr:2-hydroxychromene-2-carboxylate isomerase [Stellaceae bacterium]